MIVHIRGHVIAADRYGAYQTPVPQPPNRRKHEITPPLISLRSQHHLNRVAQSHLDAHIRRLIRLYDLINKG